MWQILYQCVFDALVHNYLRFARQLASRYFKSEIMRKHLEKVESELFIVGRKMTQPVGVRLGKKKEASLQLGTQIFQVLYLLRHQKCHCKSEYYVGKLEELGKL